MAHRSYRQHRRFHRSARNLECRHLRISTALGLCAPDFYLISQRVPKSALALRSPRGLSNLPRVSL